MATSMILKSEQNEILGYLLLYDSKLDCLTRGNGQSGTLYLFAEDHAEEKIEIICDAQEHSFQYSGGKMHGACVLADGKLFASTDKKAAQEGRRFCGKPISERTETNVVQNVIEDECNEQQTSILSDVQMRWPPPACWPSAHYVGGSWKEAQDG